MAKLNRIDQPVFAGNNTEADNAIAVFGTMKTSAEYTMDLADLYDRSTAYTIGWQNAVTAGYAPFLEELNGIHYGFSYQLQYLQQQGIPEWSPTTEYYNGSLAKLNTANGCQVYSSLVDNNIGHNVVNNPTYWKLVFDSSVVYAIDNEVVHNTMPETVGGAKTFTSNVIQSGSNSPAFAKVNTNLSKGTAPSSTYTARYCLYDNINLNLANAIAGVFFSYQQDGKTRSALVAYKPTSGSSTFASIDIYYDSDGNVTTHAPTPSSVSDSSTNIATTAFVNNVLKAIYPVGSTYIGVQSTCPMATLIAGSTWEKVGTSILLGTNTNVPVKGTGKTLGLTNGVTNVGLNSTNQESNNRIFNSYAFDTNVSGTIAAPDDRVGVFGVVTDGSKSGMVADLSSNKLTVNIWKRTA